MPIFSSNLVPGIVASALAFAYPMPMGQSVQPGSLTKAGSEIVDIDEDRAQRMTVPVSIEGRGPFSFVIDTGAERTVLSRKIATRLALDEEERANASAELEKASGGPVMLMSGVAHDGVTEVLRMLRGEIDDDRLRHRPQEDVAPWQP